ncbi:MAG: glycosyltransferase family 2 protein, partial [Panacagrimonas sp.]
MFDPCVVIPFYRHERAIGALVAELRPLRLPTYLVDDGSGPECAAVLDALEREEVAWLNVLRHTQ